MESVAVDAGSGGRYVWWVCGWCFATAVETAGEGLGRPWYLPVDRRWALATDAPGEVHAVVTTARSLCGRSLDGDEGPGSSWSPGHPDACARCVERAHVVDARWPQEKRGRRWRSSAF